jgi:formate dehydrogenase subunit gamma
MIPIVSSTQSAVQAALARHRGVEGPLLPVLHALQDALGHVPRDAVPLVATALNLSRAEVHGVVTYYRHFREAPPVGPLLKVCRAEACQAMGGDVLWMHAQTLVGYTVEPVYCLGLCASSPALMLGDALHARMTPQRLDALLK